MDTISALGKTKERHKLALKCNLIMRVLFLDLKKGRLKVDDHTYFYD